MIILVIIATAYKLKDSEVSEKQMEQKMKETVMRQLSIGRWTPTEFIATKLNMTAEEVNKILFSLEKEDKAVLRNQRDTRSLKNNYTWIRIKGKIR